MTMHRLSAAFIFSSLFVTTVAFAQPEPESPPDAVPAPSDASSDGSAGATASAGAPLVYAPEPPPARAASCTWTDRPCAYPHLAVAVDLGVSHFVEGGPFGFGTGTGSVTSTGPAWGVRIGAEFTSWFAVEAHYIGMSNHADDAVSVGGSRGLLTSAAVAELRFTVPTPYIQPYLFLGGGIYSTSLTGSSASTQLTGSTEFGVPVGVGFGIPVVRGITVGAEVTYHRFFGESFSANEDFGGGEPTAANAVVRFRF
jgi:hypothetical protein